MISCFKGKFKVTSPRGYRTLFGKQDFHKGLDVVALGADKAVYAIADGVVEATPYEANGFGYYVRQKLSDGRHIYYGHMAKGSVCVKAGQAIRQGDKVGVMGSTGQSTGAHTHIEVRADLNPSNPANDVCLITNIPNKVGTYEAGGEVDYAEIIKKKCGLEDKTIDYLKAYKWADDLLKKIAIKLK